MISFFRFAAVMIPAVFITACSAPRKVSGPQYRLLDTLTVSARNNPLDIYRATSPRVWEIEHTSVRLRFDFPKKEAHGTATLLIRPFAIPADTLVLDAKDMVISTVATVQGDVISNLAYTYDSSQLRIPVKGLDFGTLSQPAKQAFYIEYTARPYAGETGGSKAITEDRGLYFINTDHAIPGKPVQIWTQGETESNSHWLPTIDKPNQRTRLDLSLVVPDSMQTLSNGRLVDSKPLGSGMRQDNWRMEQPIQVYAIMLAVGRFAITKDSWKDAAGKTYEVNYYTEPAYAPYARGMFKNTPEMMSFFSQITGVSYPWNKYSQIVVRDYVSGAMENTTASLFGEWMNQNDRQLLDAGSEDVVAHELFHQWFGDYVTAESWSHLTLSESFATYGQQLWRRYKYELYSAQEAAFNDLQTYLAAAERHDPPLVRFHYRDKEEMFDRISYQKGASILHYINSLTGDSLFNRAMNIYLRRHALGSAEASDWRHALEEATGQDWTRFFDQWYARGGHPVLRVRYDYDDAAKVLRVSVRQAPSPDSSVKYTLPLKTAIISGGERQTVDWLIADRTHSFSYPYRNGVRPVLIPDALHVLPGIIIEDKTPAEWLVQLKASDHYVSKRQAVNGAMAKQTDPVSLNIMQAGLEDRLVGIREHTLNQLLRIRTQSWKDVLTRQVAYLAQTDGANRVRAAAMNVLGAWEVRAELPTIVAATNDSSYYVAGSALNALRQLDADSAYGIGQRLLATDPKGWLLPATWSAIVTKGDPRDIERFETRALHVYGTVKISFADNLQRYAKAVTSDSLYERTLKLLTDMQRNEPIRLYRMAIASNLFELQKAYSDEAAKGGRTAAAAASRLQITRRYTEEILAGEREEANLRQYKEILR